MTTGWDVDVRDRGDKTNGRSGSVNVICPGGYASLVLGTGQSFGEQPVNMGILSRIVDEGTYTATVD